MRLFLQVRWVVLLPLTCGCNNAREEKAPAAVPKVAEEKPQPTTAKTPVEAPGVEAKAAIAQEPWGTVKGRIVWGGKEIPKREEILIPMMNQDRNFCLNDGPFPEDTWIVDPKNKGLRYTFVWLAPVEKEGKLAIHPARTKLAPGEEKVFIDQPICMFVPHALALREGQILVVKNSAKVQHSFKWSGSDINTGGNATIPAGGQDELKIKADRMLITVECGFHPWMRASILAFDHPYFAVTDEQGRFEIKNAPAGPCRLMIRHSTGIYLGGAKGRSGQPIKIEPGGNDLGAIEYPEPPKN